MYRGGHNSYINRNRNEADLLTKLGGSDVLPDIRTLQEKQVGYLADIQFFGDVAAEQDNDILSYFLKTPALDDIDSGSKHLVLGRKGSGKTALVRYFSAPKVGQLSITMNLSNYPWGVHKERVNLGASEVESYVSSWRYMLAVQISTALLNHANFKMVRDSQKAAYTFLLDNYGAARPNLDELLRPKQIKLSKASFRPTFMGASVGSIDFDTPAGGVSPNIDSLTDAVIENAITMMSQQGISKISLHFDELDKGLSNLDTDREKMLIGLVLAARYFHANKKTSGRICPIVYLRTDIWEQMSFSDKNKISQSSSVILEWDSDSLKRLVDLRISGKAGAGLSWKDIEDGALMRGSQSKWSHIISRTFLRPRDVIQFLNIIAEIAIKEMPEADIIENSDIVAARETYSKYLKDELDDEIRTHWSKWTVCLQTISEMKTTSFSRKDFDVAWAKKKESHVTPSDDALELMYNYSVLGYRRSFGKGGTTWVYQYTHPDSGWDNSASLLQIHPGLKEFTKLREARARA